MDTVLTKIKLDGMIKAMPYTSKKYTMVMSIIFPEIKRFGLNEHELACAYSIIWKELIKKESGSSEIEVNYKDKKAYIFVKDFKTISKFISLTKTFKTVGLTEIKELKLLYINKYSNCILGLEDNKVLKFIDVSARGLSLFRPDEALEEDVMREYEDTLKECNTLFKTSQCLTNLKLNIVEDISLGKDISRKLTLFHILTQNYLGKGNVLYSMIDREVENYSGCLL